MQRCNYYQFVGAGSLGGLATGIFASHFWAKGKIISFNATLITHYYHVHPNKTSFLFESFCMFDNMLDNSFSLS